jgi:molybdenum cofactor guanylyltransferase
MEQETISRQFAPDERGTLLEYVLDSIWTVTDELCIVFKKEPDLATIESISSFGAKIFNVPENESPVLQVITAFKSCRSEHCALVTETIPLLKPNVVLALFNAAANSDLAIPRWNNGKVEPLLAVYRVNALLKLWASQKNPPARDLDSAMRDLSSQLFDVNYVSIEKDLSELDPELDSFLKVESEESLAKARSKASIRVNRMKKSD